MIPGLQKVEYKSVGNKETISFKKDVGTSYPWTFEAWNMSDGALRILGILLAVLQPGPSSVIAIEEPESTVHPALAESLVQILVNASRKVQVLVTTHSPDILDQKEIMAEQIRGVEIHKNRTIVSILSQSNRDAIREKRYTPGELLRMNELSLEKKYPARFKPNWTCHNYDFAFCRRAIGNRLGRHSDP